MCNGYLPEKAYELFDLFADDDFGRIRLIGVKIGKRYGLDISKFLSDTDGHVRKAAKSKT